MDKDFHIDCYVCGDCGMQLTDEPGKRCYPLNNSLLLCYLCHLKRLGVDDFSDVLHESSINSSNMNNSSINQHPHNSSISSNQHHHQNMQQHYNNYFVDR